MKHAPTVPTRVSPIGDVEQLTRQCEKCGQIKPLYEFVKDSRKLLGRRHSCKECRNAYDRQWGANLSVRARRREYAQSSVRHRIYKTWHTMIERCHDKRHDAFRRYGMRGITVCAEWRESFEAFRVWALANGYDEKLTIDRKKPNDSYSPSTCRWTTMKVQSVNRRGSMSSSSRYKGVRRKKNRWQAQLANDGNRVYLGSFRFALHAALAYDSAAYSLWGDDVYLNFPEVIKGKGAAE